MIYKRMQTCVHGLLVFALVWTLLPSMALAQSNAPMSSMVAVTLTDDQGTGAENAADFVKGLVEQYANDELSEDIQFPLANAATDSVRALDGFQSNVVVSWLDPLTWDNSVDAPRYGANNDYIAYFGD